MCGIAGYIDFGGDAPSRPILQAMADSITHRGPDEGGIWQEGACGLAHRRLSIIDLSGSKQPLAPETSDLALVYNGEIYNYQPLREALAQRGASYTPTLSNTIEVQGVPAELIGDLAALERIPLHELHTEEATLEEAFLEITQHSQEYTSGENPWTHRPPTS